MLPSCSICKSDESFCPVCGKVLLVAKLFSPVVATGIHSDCLSQSLYLDKCHMYLDPSSDALFVANISALPVAKFFSFSSILS
jgi:hypothetical protein